MADITKVSVFSVKYGGSASMLTSEIKAAASTQIVPCGKDSRLAIRVANTGSVDITVRVIAGDGPRAVRKDMDVLVGANKTAYIALFDTARYKAEYTETVNEETTTYHGVKVSLYSGDTLLTDCSAIKIEAVQL